MNYDVGAELIRIGNSIHAIEAEYGIDCRLMRGIGCIERETLYWEVNDDARKKLWPLVTEDDYGFIGMTPNQRRPSVNVFCYVNGVRILVYAYKTHSYDTYDGGFLSDHDSIIEATQGAPSFIKQKIAELREYCVYNDENHAAKKELEQIEIRKAELLSQIGC